MVHHNDNTTYTSYNVCLDKDTKHFVYHQSCLAVKDSLQMLDKIDDINGSLEAIASKCHKSLMLHANMVEKLREDYFESNYRVTLEQDDEVGVEDLSDFFDAREVDDEEEERKMREKMKIINVGDIVTCTGGERRGASRYCSVVQVSKSRKTYILRDEEGNEFQKYSHCISKYNIN